MNMALPTQLDRDGIDLGRLIGMLLDHKWRIVFITSLFTAGGVLYTILATPIYQGDALVQIEHRSSVSPLGDLANVMGTGDTPDSSTAAELQILQSRLVLGQVVDRVGLDTVIRPKRPPLVGNFIERHQIARPNFLIHRLDLAEWLPRRLEFPAFIKEIPATPEMLKGSIAVPDILKSELFFPDFLQGRTLVWGGESLLLARLEVADPLRGSPLIVTAGERGAYTLTLGGEKPRVLGQGQVGELASFANGDIELRLAEIDAPEGAQFILIKRSRPAAIESLGNRLKVDEIGGGRIANTGMLRLTMTGPDPDEIRRSLDAVAETFLTQNVQRQSAEAEKSLAFLEEQAPQLRDQLAVAEDSLNRYRTEQNSVDLSAEAEATVQQFIELESRLSELEFQEAEL
ncbi:Wzz/FepE/Etk N-terminal domain-containing protein, partial [Halomonas sp. CS7]